MPTKKDRLEMLGTVPLLQDLSKRELDQVLRAAKEVDHDTGKAIVKEGETGAGFHLILEGQVKVTVGNRLRARLGPGDFFGEIALIDGGARTATVTSETPVRTLSLTWWDFRPLIEEHPAISFKLLVELCRRLRAAQRVSKDLSA